MDEVKIDLRSVVFDILKNIVIIIMVSAAAMLAGHMLFKSSHKPVYTSKFSYVVVSNEASLVSNTANQSKLVKVFQEVMESNVLKNKVEASLGYGEGEHMTAEISTEIVQTTNINDIQENTNIIVVTVKDTHPTNAYYTAKAIMANCGSVSEYINKNATLTVLEKPSIPTGDSEAVNYIKTDIMIFAAVFVLLCGIAAFISIRRDSIRTSEEIKEKLNSRLLASVPDITLKDKKKKSKAGTLLVTDEHTGFYYIENIKKIRSKVEIEKEDDGMCIAVASILPQEGRTTIAANLALSLAMHGGKVLLVDMDFKKPELHKVLRYNGEVASITDFLNGDGTLTQSLRSVEGMKVLFQKESASNSSELIDSKNMKIFLDYVKEQFDYVIIDTTPISSSADVEVLSGIIDHALLVVKQDCAPSADINAAIDMLERNKCSLIGCVFNRDTKIAKEGSYGYGYYGRYSGYGNYSDYNKTSDK